MAKQDDGLFLLEVLIEKIVFKKSPCFSDKDFRTCVNIECPAVEPLEICDDDPGVCVAKSGGPFVKTFNNGKSCLFSLKESDISSAMSKFPVKVSVYKSLPCGCLPTKIIMGEATIDMTKEFVQARKKFLEDPNNVSFQALKDSFRIIGPDKDETGEIVMFLRISCFGKLIITRFQGSGGPPTLGGPGANNAIVDRSCNPQKGFQTPKDPCACGSARGHHADGAGGSSGQPCAAHGGAGMGLCPLARDPYNSMPCEDLDDPCYCSGPKPPAKQQMDCRNTDQYCLHVPKGELPRMPYFQDMTDDQKHHIRATGNEQHTYQNYATFKSNSSNQNETDQEQDSSEYLQIKLPLPNESNITSQCSSYTSCLSSYTLRSKRRSVSFSNTMDYIWKSRSRKSYYSKNNQSDINATESKFGTKETAVYMTLFDEFCRHRASGTQATASINKCFQVSRENTNENQLISLCPNSDYSTTTMSTIPYRSNLKHASVKSHCPEVYFFGKKEEKKNTGKGTSKTSKIDNKKKNVESNSCSQTNAAQTKKPKSSCASTCTSKVVSIKEDGCPSVCPNNVCPAVAGTKGDIVATVSHIKIGPREPCPVHGKEPCQGPKCIIAASGEDKVPVKVSTVTNPRRGVFELVIRKMTGAPLAKNELMLEWTPPPCRPPPCGVPCPISCTPPGSCRPSKCRMIVCRSSPCKSRCYKGRVCKRPCGPVPCRVVSCLSCCKGLPRLPCKPCPPPRCKPCRPCKPCKPCRPCGPCPPCKPFRPNKPFKKPCRPCKPCGPCTPCRPSRPCKQCKPCVPCKPCGPSSPCTRCVACMPCIVTSPCIFSTPGSCSPCLPTVMCRPSKPCRPFKTCKSPPCSPCSPCSPSPCGPCSPSPPCSPRIRRPPRACKPCKPCPPCKPCRPCLPCKPRRPRKPFKPVPRCKPCRSCRDPCPPSPCCDSPCMTPCCLPLCTSPCKSSPCLSPCPAKRKRTRKSHSQPRMKAHKKHISPCSNRLKSCPVVRCRSVPGPCITCCGRPPYCPPPACCPAPCKPIRCCKSACSTNCI